MIVSGEQRKLTNVVPRKERIFGDTLHFLCGGAGGGGISAKICLRMKGKREAREGSQERANLFEVFLEPDGPLEMFHLKQSWSLQVFGSASGSGCLPEEEGEELLLTGSPS